MRISILSILSRYCNSSALRAYTLNYLKYIFYIKNVEFLGFIITPRGIIIDSTYVKAIEEWPKPKSYRDI